MFKSYLFFNLFFSLIHFGFLNDSSSRNQINTSSPNTLFKKNLFENEFLQNRNTYKKNVTENSSLCGLKKKVKEDEIEQKGTPLFRFTIQKPYENLNINLSNVNSNSPQIRPLRYVNNSDNINSDQSLNTTMNEKSGIPSSFKPIGNNIHAEKSQTLSYINNNNKTTVLKTDSTLRSILSKNNYCKQIHSLDKGNRTDVKSKARDSQTVYEKFEYNPTWEEDKRVKNIIGKDNTEENVNGDTYIAQTSTQEDVSLSSDSNEFDRIQDSENIHRLGQRRSNKIVYSDKQSDSNESELGESELIDYTNINANDINQQLIQSKSGTMLSELDDTNPLLIENSRICYACSSVDDLSCLKPNRQTTVKYCHKDHDACVVKNYKIGSPNYLVRDCASSCKPTEFFGVIIKYESCSICHSDLCNSAYSISLSIILCFSLFTILTIFY